MDDDPLLGLGLRPVTLADQPKFNEYLASLRNPLSDYTFSQLFTWGNSLRILWTELHSHLCVFANGTGDLTMLMPPLGSGSSDRALMDAFDIMDTYNNAHQAHGHSRVEYASEELLPRFDLKAMTIEPMGFDYVYDVARMIDLAGGELASKRQLKNRFLRNYEARVETYDPTRHRTECLRLLGLWKSHQDLQHQQSHHTAAVKRQKEALACELTLEWATQIGVTGIVVYTRPRQVQSAPGCGGEGWTLSGFTFGELLGAEESSILIEKTDLSVRGLPQFIFSEFCRLCWANRPRVNAGDDWGLETLAWTKASYHPIERLRKFSFQPASRTMVQVPVQVCPGVGLGPVWPPPRAARADLSVSPLAPSCA